MKLLIITQTVDKNHAVLGFFLGWIEEFAKHCERVTVLCLEKKEYSLPENTAVLSLGKEDGASRLKYTLRFYKYIWQKRNDYDAVFVHMNPIYVVLGGLFWRWQSKKIGLWYAHGSVNAVLRLATILSDLVFTASEKSFRITSKKKKVVGHGIDLNKFKAAGSKPENANKLKLVTVGRISPVKDYETLINAVELLKKDKINASARIIGGPAAKKDIEYQESLTRLVKEKGLEGAIEFIGAVGHQEVPGYLAQADVFVHMSRTGSLDKALLEATASGLPSMSCNEASKEFFGEYKSALFFEPGNEQELKEKIMNVIRGDSRQMQNFLYQKIKDQHEIGALIKKIVVFYE